MLKPQQRANAAFTLRRQRRVKDSDGRRVNGKPEKVLWVELILHKKMPEAGRKLLKYFAGSFLEAAAAKLSRFAPDY
jgi:hypothetical protein